MCGVSVHSRGKDELNGFGLAIGIWVNYLGVKMKSEGIINDSCLDDIYLVVLGIELKVLLLPYHLR
jgi:hypothetical protein